MSIRQQIDDAVFLASVGRYVGSLSILMLAVSASARKTFPQKIKNRKNKWEYVVKDRDAFVRFLRNRFLSLFSSGVDGLDSNISLFGTSFLGEISSVEEVLYRYYRCTLVHEGALPCNVEFLSSPTGSESGSLSLEFSGSADKVVFYHGIIEVLIRAVREAKCNGFEFGIRHVSLVPRDGVDEQVFLDVAKAKFNAMPSRVHILKTAYKKFERSDLERLSDAEVVEEFARQVATGSLGAISALWTHEHTSMDGVLLPLGIALIREISKFYILIDE